MQKSFFELIFEGLRGNVRSPSIAVKKPVVGFLFLIIELFCYLLRLRRYKRKSIKVGVFRRWWVTLSANLRRKGESPADHCWCHKTRVIAPSCGIKISAVYCLGFTVRLHVMQRTVLLSQFCLSVCPSVCLSVRQMRVLWQNQTTHCEYFDTTRNGNHSSFLTPTEVGGRCPLPSEICAQSDPPPSKNADFDRSAHNVSTVGDSEKSSITTNIKSTTGFPTSHRWSSYVTPKCPKGWLKEPVFRFYRASICDGGLGSRNSVCLSVCHTRWLWQN